MIRNSKWTFDVKQFQQSFGTCKIVIWVLLSNCRSSLLYIEVWKDQFHTNDQIKSFEAWSNHQWSVVWFGYCPIRINFKSIPSLEEHCCRHSCCSCTSRHKNGVVEIVVVHFVQMSFFNSLNWISIQCLQIYLK